MGTQLTGLRDQERGPTKSWFTHPEDPDYEARSLRNLIDKSYKISK
jgi:hypothetical protein